MIWPELFEEFRTPEELYAKVQAAQAQEKEALEVEPYTSLAHVAIHSRGMLDRSEEELE